jgi:hypothetical protein
MEHGLFGLHPVFLQVTIFKLRIKIAECIIFLGFAAVLLVGADQMMHYFYY